MSIQDHWQLNPDVDYLNHGSFGAAPTVVLQAQRRFQDALERDPIAFLAQERELEPKLDHVRDVLAAIVGAPARDLVFVRNATDGVNAVLRSFPFDRGDEIVITDHGYNACNNAARFAAERWGATVRVAKIPFPLIDSEQAFDAIAAEWTDRTRVLLVDHVTSPTGLVLPVDKIIAAARQRGIRVLIDGAHAAGMVPLDICKLGADYYTANHHKWLCAPKASGFLYVRPELQEEVRPTVISHGANRTRPGRTRFMTEFDWIGTYDPTPIMSVPTAIEFLESLFPGGMNELMTRNRILALKARDVLCQAMSIRPPAPDDMIGSLVSVPLPQRQGPQQTPLDALHVKLFQEHRIEAPVFTGPGCGRMLRISLQAYNSIEQVERLASAIVPHT